MSVKKIVIIGLESTGKSTLTQALAAAYKEPYVQEYAREYIEKLDRPYKIDDLLSIAKGQIEAEDLALIKAKKYLFIDTDLQVLNVWSQYKYGTTDPWILDQIENRKYDLYLLTHIDIPWEADPQREHPETQMRVYFFNLYKELLQKTHIPFEIIQGNYQERFDLALKALRNTML